MAISPKAEAVRAGILRLGQDYGLVKPAAHYWPELSGHVFKLAKLSEKENEPRVAFFKNSVYEDVGIKIGLARLPSQEASRPHRFAYEP